MEQEFKEQLLSVAVLHSAAQKAINVIEAQEKTIENLQEEISDKSDEIRNGQQDINVLMEERDSATEKLEEAGIPENLVDEMKLKLVHRLRENCTLEQLENLEGMARQMVRNYKEH